MMPAQVEYWHGVERSSRKPGNPHPDECSILRIKRTQWPIPRRGKALVPRFDGDTVTMEDSGAGDLPEVKALADCFDDEGRATLDVSRSPEALLAAWALARKLLLAYHDLTDVVLTDLLTIETDLEAEWIGQLVRWGLGLPMGAK